MSASLQSTLKGHCDNTEVLSDLISELNGLVKQFAAGQKKCGELMEQIANRVVHSELMPEPETNDDPMPKHTSEFSIKLRKLGGYFKMVRACSAAPASVY